MALGVALLFREAEKGRVTLAAPGLRATLELRPQ
jgi:hypothetical protein